jgi:hypothetical protein
VIRLTPSSGLNGSQGEIELHKNKAPKFITSVLAIFTLVFGGVLALPTAANAVACGGALPTVTLVTDPIMYSGLPTYDANYIGYKVTRGSADTTSSFTVTLNNFSNSRISLAPSQAATQTVGALTVGAPTKYVFFLAKLGTASATSTSHDVVLTDGVATCTDTTTLNPATAVNPAATSNNSNKVESVTIGTAPNAVGGTITVTVKGDTGQVGTNEGISFAPISNSSFPADKWTLESSTIKINQNASYAAETDTFSNRLYLPYNAPAGVTYSDANLGAIDGKYTAIYTFKLIAATGASTQMKPIQYVGNVYTGSMPAGAAPTISASGSAAVAPTISPSNQSISGTSGLAITSSSAYTPTNFSVGATYSYAISPALPANLSINPTTGVISGTPSSTSALATYTVTVTNTALNSETATASIDLEVTAAPQPQNNTTPAPEPDRKVTICHRTHSETNPYVRITVDYNSVNKKSGHQIHDEIFAGEHVFKAGIYKRAKDKDWGDIIPADPSGLNRWKPLNWTTLGAQIYNGTVAGCPAYDAVKYYNAMREAGVPEKKIKQEMKELEDEQSEAQPSREKKDPTTLKYSGTSTKALEEENDKVTICHRTNSVTNPYVRITVSSSSIYKTKGHYGHDEIYDGNHVFDSTVDYPNNRKDWGDIIPADPTGKNRWAPLNMTALGKTIYDGTVAGCAEKTAQQLYNELREEGKSKKEIMKDLEEQKSLDEDPKDLDELKYTGADPKVEKTEPKEPVDPSDPSNLNPVKIPDQSLSGIVWLDINKDGLKDPDEPLMKNIKLYVVQLSSIPTPVSPASLQSSSTLRRTDVPVRAAAVKEVLTDANGFYLFASLGAGDWMVTTTIPEDLYVTYDSHESADGSITTTVPVASHAFTWVGLVGEDEKVTLAKLTEILKENPNALPESELPAALKVLVKKAKTALAGKTSLAETGTQDLAWFYFGILLMLTGVALRFARTKQ